MNSRYISVKQCVVPRNTVNQFFEKDLRIMKLVNRPFLNLRRFKKVYKMVIGSEIKSKITIFRIDKVGNLFMLYYGINVYIDPSFLDVRGYVKEEFVDNCYSVICSENPLVELFYDIFQNDKEPEYEKTQFGPKIVVPSGREYHLSGVGNFQGIRQIESMEVSAKVVRLAIGLKKYTIPKLCRHVRKQILDRCDIKTKMKLIVKKPVVVDAQNDKLLKMKEKFKLLKIGTKEYRDLKNAILSLTNLLAHKN